MGEFDDIPAEVKRQAREAAGSEVGAMVLFSFAIVMAVMFVGFLAAMFFGLEGWDPANWTVVEGAVVGVASASVLAAYKEYRAELGSRAAEYRRRLDAQDDDGLGGS